LKMSTKEKNSLAEEGWVYHNNAVL
jgi:hypothetical protein